VSGVAPPSTQQRGLRLFVRLHGRLLVRTRGRPSRLSPRMRALVLETVGRRSGHRRPVVLAYLPEGEDFVVLASNFGSEHPPAWWWNLQAAPDAVVHIDGRRIPVRAQELDGPRREAILVRAAERNKQWRTYVATMQRPLPVVLLSRR